MLGGDPILVLEPVFAMSDGSGFSMLVDMRDYYLEFLTKDLQDCGLSYSIADSTQWRPNPSIFPCDMEDEAMIYQEVLRAGRGGMLADIPHELPYREHGHCGH